jgi:hypothetical protein
LQLVKDVKPVGGDGRRYHLRKRPPPWQPGQALAP